MIFKSAVEQSAQLQSAYCDGLQALTAADRACIRTEDPRRLTGSIDIDTTLSKACPNDPRWDYAIGHQPANLDSEVVYWVEVHPASDREITVVLNKLQWLKSWLQANAEELLAMPREFVWISSGRTSFTPTSPQKRRCAAQGLQHMGTFLHMRAEYRD
ncbi:MAG: hypothetical protein KF708_10615 [Pirellulales bacterium]|nr:hypothetical protein [Pirellulales bacterium]